MYHAGARLITVADALAAAAALGPDGRGRFDAPAVLQSWPGIVHGGGLVAVLDAVVGALGTRDEPRVIEGRLTSSVPVATALVLEGSAHAEGALVSILQNGQTLTSASVRPSAAAPLAAPPEREPRDGTALPMSDDCLACGARNPLGLQQALRFDAEGVWARLIPRGPWRLDAARAHTALAPVLLDEVAWWLGALMMREGGLTNRIQVTLHASPLPATGALFAAGRFADVTPVDRKRTFWRTVCALFDEGGRTLAEAAIVFRGGPEWSARQMPYFKARTDPATFAGMFPSYV